jgi:hypothetical protein
MRLSRLMAVALLPALATCATATPGGRDCRGGPAQVVNASSQAVEQLYLGADPAEPGADRLGPAGLPPRASLTLDRPPGPRLALRVVWVNGRAAEFASTEACGLNRVTIMDGGIRAE